MRKIFVIFMLVGVASFGCGPSKAMQAAEDKAVVGEWTVVSTYCLDVLAEKDGTRRVFVYTPPSGSFHFGQAGLIERCKEVKPGWKIQAESTREYHFFPSTITPNHKEENHGK